MASVSGISTISKVFSKLGDNTGSVVPMYVKDITSDTLTSMTYYKEGGKMDGPEKTLEEFGTGVLWLGGIPFIKKHLFDNFIFKKQNINPDIDATKLFAGNNKKNVDTVEFASNKAKSLGKEFKEQADILADTVKNKSKAKNLALWKFGVSTALTGLALFGLITFKQKRTEKQLRKEIEAKHQKDNYEKSVIEDSSVYQIFKGKTNPNQNQGPSFKGGLGTFIMTNPIANTSIVDGIITGTRLAQAREGEIFEVGLKEGCELAFIYGLAQPMQKGLEAISEKFLKKPIQLDYSVLESNFVKEALTAEKTKAGSSDLMKQAKAIIALASGGEEEAVGIKKFTNFIKNKLHPAKAQTKQAKEGAKSALGLFKKEKVTNENAKKVIDFVFKKENSAIVDIYKRTGDIATFTTKEGKEQLSLLSSISADKLKQTAQNTVKLLEEGAKSENTTKFLKGTKFAKGASIIANIGISAILIGYLEPKLNLYLRKKRNNGNNVNPAIRAIEKEYKMGLEKKQQ